MLELALTFPMFAVEFVISMYSEFSVDNVAGLVYNIYAYMLTGPQWFRQGF